MWIIVPLLWASCSRDHSDAVIPADDEPVSRYHVAQTKALESLQVFLDDMEPAQTRSSGTRRQVKTVETVAAPAALTRSGQYDAENLFYVVSFEGDEGCAILAADSRLEPVIALTDVGALTLEDFLKATSPATRADNSSVGDDDSFTPVAEGEEGAFIAGLLTDYAIVTLSSGGSDVDMPEDDIEDSPSDYYYQIAERVGPLLKTKWDQTNSQGCWAVVIAQICGYHRFPANYNGHTYNWNDIYKYKSFIDGVWSGNYSYRDKLTVLLNDIMEAGDTKPHGLLNDSGTAKAAGKGMGRLGFVNVDIDRSYNESTILSMLRQGKPVPFRGKRDGFLGINGKGHSWVIDGFIRSKDMNNRYADKKYVHCNFGWSTGNHDGYYFSGSFVIGYKDLIYERDLNESASEQAHEYYGTNYSEAHAYINYDLP